MAALCGHFYTLFCSGEYYAHILWRELEIKRLWNLLTSNSFWMRFNSLVWTCWLRSIGCHHKFPKIINCKLNSRIKSKCSPTKICILNKITLLFWLEQMKAGWDWMIYYRNLKWSCILAWMKVTISKLLYQKRNQHSMLFL